MSDEGQPPPSQQDPTFHDDEPTHPGVPPQMETQAESPEATSSEPAAQVQGEPSVEAASPPPGEPAPLIEAPTQPKWKQQLHGWAQKAKESQWVRNLGARIQNFEPAVAADWASKNLKRQNAGIYGKGATIALCAFFLADLMALMVGKYIPDPPVSHPNRPGANFRRPKTIDDYNGIFARNLFNSAGTIPGENTGTQTTQPDLGGAPVRTSLPFNLVGTMILQDELRSIATVEDKTAATVYPVRETDEIPSKAKIVKIEPRKVTFLNLANSRMEFVDIPDDPNAMPVTNARVSVGKAATPGIEKISPNQYNVQRSEVDKALQDLNKVLTEARAVPNFENGVANGYKLFQIVPGSIYDKLGLVNGDVITGLNGAAINDPGKAFEMLSELKTSNHLELQVKKDGKVQNNVYDIR